MSNLGQFPC